MFKKERELVTRLNRLRDNWEILAKDDPMWAILTHPDKKNNNWQVESFFSTGEEFVAVLMKLYESLKIQLKWNDALDFGCGLGRLTQPLARWFQRVVGTDVSWEMITQAGKHNKHPGKVSYVKNTENLPFGGDMFDYIQSHIVLQHIDADLTLHYLEEFIRVLRPGGVLYFQLPEKVGNSSGIAHFENDIVTGIGTVSMDMNAVPKETVLEKLHALGAVCLYSKTDLCADGMHSCTYVATLNKT